MKSTEHGPNFVQIYRERLAAIPNLTGLRRHLQSIDTDMADMGITAKWAPGFTFRAETSSGPSNELWIEDPSTLPRPAVLHSDAEPRLISFAGHFRIHTWGRRNTYVVQNHKQETFLLFPDIELVRSYEQSERFLEAAQDLTNRYGIRRVIGGSQNERGSIDLVVGGIRDEELLRQYIYDHGLTVTEALRFRGLALNRPPNTSFDQIFRQMRED